VKVVRVQWRWPLAQERRRPPQPRNTPKYYIKSRKNISGHSDRVLAQNLNTVFLALPFGLKTPHCKILPGGVDTHSKAPIRETQIQGLKYRHSYDKGSESYQIIDFLKTGILNSYPAMYFLSTGVLKSYQAIYLCMTVDHNIIPGNILSYDTGS